MSHDTALGFHSFQLFASSLRCPLHVVASPQISELFEGMPAFGKVDGLLRLTQCFKVRGALISTRLSLQLPGVPCKLPSPGLSRPNDASLAKYRSQSAISDLRKRQGQARGRAMLSLCCAAGRAGPSKPGKECRTCTSEPVRAARAPATPGIQFSVPAHS